MGTVGIRELKQDASQILRRVREEGESYNVTYRGRVIARLVPVTEPEVGEVSLDEFLAEWDALIEDFSADWPEGYSAVDAVREGRERHG